MAKTGNDWYRRLTRLFRTDAALKRRVRDTRVPVKSTATTLFSKSLGFGYNHAVNSFASFDRLGRYGDFQEMEMTPEISAALDIYADETVSQDETGKVLHIFSENRKLRELLGELFYDVLNIDFNLRPWTRNLCKYGDCFLFHDIAPGHGVLGTFPVPVNEVEREEGFDNDEPAAVRFKWATQGNTTLENWQMSHFRLLGQDAFLPYGCSIIEPARRIWRQLILIEDAMMVYRVIRSPERRIFYIDVGGIPPSEVENYMAAQEAKLRSDTIVDRSTGRVDLRHNALSTESDYFIPVRGDQTGTRVETLAGGQHVSATEDVEYIQKKLFAALKIPRAYLGFEENLSSKSTLAQQDIRFSRTVQQIQKVIIAELQRIAYIHLYMNGYDGDDMFDFELRLNNPSSIAQQQKLELFARRFDIISTALGIADGKMFSMQYLLRTIMDMPERDQHQLYDEVVKDLERLNKLDKLGEGGTVESLGLGGGGGGAGRPPAAGAGDGGAFDDVDVDSANDDPDVGAEADADTETGDSEVGEDDELDDLFQGDALTGDVLTAGDEQGGSKRSPSFIDAVAMSEPDAVTINNAVAKKKQYNRKRRHDRGRGPIGTAMPDLLRATSMQDPQDQPLDARSLYDDGDVMPTIEAKCLSISDFEAVIAEHVAEICDVSERFYTPRPRMTSDLERMFEKMNAAFDGDMRSNIDKLTTVLVEDVDM
jgi:hypothetical protein